MTKLICCNCGYALNDDWGISLENCGRCILCHCPICNHVNEIDNYDDSPILYDSNSAVVNYQSSLQRDIYPIFDSYTEKYIIELTDRENTKCVKCATSFNADWKIKRCNDYIVYYCSVCNASNIFPAPNLKTELNSYYGELIEKVDSRKGENLSMDFLVSFREAYTGCDKRLPLIRDGKLEVLLVEVPAGVDNDTCLLVRGKGGEGIEGAPSGDLFLNIIVDKDPHFYRKGNDIFVHKQINISEAERGTSIEIVTLEGTKRIKIPSGIQHGENIRLKGLGFPSVWNRGRGDFYVMIEVKVPD
jgi:hypothetical protein